MKQMKNLIQLRSWAKPKEMAMLGTIILVILVLLLVGAFPAYPYSRSWGYGPSGVIGILVIILIILLLTGRL